MKTIQILSITLILVIFGQSPLYSYFNQPDTIGGYDICLQKNLYNWFDNNTEMEKITGVDSPESTSRLQIILRSPHAVYQDIEDIGNKTSKEGMINVVLRHYSSGAQIYRKRKESELKAIVDLNGKYRYHTKKELEGGVVEIRSPSYSPTGIQHYFLIEEENIFESWISSCFYLSKPNATCHISDVFKNEFFVQIEFPSEYALYSKDIKSRIFTWLEKNVLRHECDY